MTNAARSSNLSTGINKSMETRNKKAQISIEIFCLIETKSLFISTLVISVSIFTWLSIK
ncbi:hypothetical protein BH23THE1_BH23THE1_25710 [soil metagenome]